MKITTQKELNDLIATANESNTIVLKEDLEITFDCKIPYNITARNITAHGNITVDGHITARNITAHGNINTKSIIYFDYYDYEYEEAENQRPALTFKNWYKLKTKKLN
jgi:restriction endonuclease